MPWYFPWSESIKKRACRYLLQHYIGQFLQEKLTLEQLSVDLYKGTGTVKEVSLDVTAINELLENSNVPVQLVDGFIGRIEVSVPWSALVSDNTNMQIHNLEITLQPTQRDETVGCVMLDSMLSSFSTMTTSMQLAQECLKPETSDAQPDSAQQYEGLEIFAQTIEAVLSKVKISFVDTIVRLEHLPREAQNGVALEIRIDRMEYFDDMAEKQGGEETRYEPVAIVHKNVQLMGVSLYCEQFPATARMHTRASQSDELESLNLHEGASPPLSPQYSSTVIADQPAKQLSECEHVSGDPVKIAVLMGTNKVKVKLKQEEEIAAPKIEVEMQVGVLNFHLSPRQVHLLMEIAEGLAAPELCDDSNIKKKRYTKSKPMQQDDFSRIENELQREMKQKHDQQHAMAGAFHHDDYDTLTSHPIDDEEDIFLSLGSVRSGHSMEGSYSSHTTTKSGATTGSLLPPHFTYGQGSEVHHIAPPRSVASSKLRQTSKDGSQRMSDDLSSDVTKYKLKLSFVSAMILHEDPPSTPSNGIDRGVTSQEKLREMADKYFGRVLGINIAGVGHDLKAIRSDFSQACPYDHISFLAKPVTLELSERYSNNMYTVSGEISVGVGELVEALYGKTSVTHEVLSMQYSPDSVPPEYCELLVFEEDGGGEASGMMGSLHTSATPCVRLKLHSDTSSAQSKRGSRGSKLEVHVELAKPCQCELDMTMVDRIHSLLNRLPLASPAKAAANPSVYNSCAQSAFHQAMEEVSHHTNRKTEIKVTSASCTVTVRFPRVDLSEGMRPWWKRSLHNELLILHLTDLQFSTCSWPQQTFDQYEFTCRDAHGLFQVSADQDPVSFIRINAAENQVNERDEGFDWPRLVLKLLPETGSVLAPDIDEYEDEGATEDRHACSALHKPHTTPFSQHTTLREHGEMVLPGNRQEMQDYEEKAQNCTRLHIDLTIPSLNAVIPDKEFLELVYNRILNDMVLWEPLAPKPLEQPNQLNIQPFQSTLMDLNIHTPNLTSFQACKSNIQDDSDSELDESMPYLSVSELRRRRRKKQAKEPSVRQQSRLCFSLHITHGQLTAYAPLKGEDMQWLQDECGMFVLFVDDATVFCEVDHNGDPELMYTCVHSNSAQLFHQGCVPVPSKTSVIGRCSEQAPPEVDKTIYLSDPGTYTKMSGGQVGHGPDSNDMLSVAVKVRLDTSKNIKECQVAVGVRAATLLHRSTPSGHNWLYQLLELFTLVDYEIAGYIPPRVIVELHAHVWGSAIDYRPLYLPYCAMLTFECFSISSNVLADSATSLLRFLVEDAALYISDKKDEPKVDLKKNYVCVADMGMFEMAVKTNDGTNQKYPTKLDLKVSNNILHIRTCADSMHALSKLINYLAKDGDMHEPDEPRPAIPKETLERVDTGNSTLGGSPQLTKLSMDTVHDMMADAMRESSSDDSNQHEDGEAAGQLFFTPGATDKPLIASSSEDELTDMITNRQKQRPKPKTGPVLSMSTSSQSKNDSLSMSVSFSKGDGDSSPDISMSLEEEPREMRSPVMDDTSKPKSSDDEFCVIDSPGLGYGARNGIPVVKMLTKKPVQIVDNHFTIPIGRTDVLKAPDHFPPAITRYTIREFSVVWYMYGGKDFDSSRSSRTSTKTARALANQRCVRSGQLSKLSWQAMGGKGRDIDVLMEVQLSKIRMQWEIYGEKDEQAARQILLINDIEIRDRLASSKINKFLYQYSSDAMPKQSHTSMVEIKALHLRPDPKLPRQECSLKISLQPLRLNIDQDALNFMRLFMTEFCKEEHEIGAATGSTDSADPLATEPIMQVAGIGEEEEICGPASFLPQLDEFSEQENVQLAAQEEAPDSSQPVFIRCFIFSPDVPIRLDYHGKRVDMGQGTMANLLVGLAQLNCSELRLKRIHYKKGLLGKDRLLRFMGEEWTNDIVKNQIPSILGGVGPMHSIVQIVHGIRDLFWLPVEQYRRDGRIVRGLQRGTHSFMTSTAMSTLELTNRLVQTVQFVAEIGYDMVTPPRSQRVPPRYRLRHPADFREGVVNAYTVITEGVKSTATDIVKGAYEGHEYKGLPGAVGGVLKQVPGAILQPVILATGATSNILDGVKNQMQPDKKREDEEKWKPDDM